MAYTFDLYFNEKSYEYDIYTLIRQFYPGAEIRILYTGAAAEEAAAASGAADKETDAADAVFHVLFENNGVRFLYKREETEIPEGDESGILPAQAEEAYGSLRDSADRLRNKRDLMAVVYHALCRMTGQQMPWGDLTGIRPTKIPMKVLDEGGTYEEAAAVLRDTYFVTEEKIRLAMDTACLEKKLLAQLHPDKGYSLYVGIPFCPSICLYCSFGSHKLKQYQKMVEPYLETLYKELRFIAEEMKDWQLDTVYIGGGTPTSISAEQLDQLLGVLSETFDLSKIKEFTVEAGRPDTITREKLEVIRRYPVTRISINPQTMNQETLDIIGRGHTVEETIEKFHLARSMGFDNINMDLIVGLPGEGEEKIIHTLEEIRKLDPDSLTVHSLALKRATRLNLFRDTYTPMSFENSARIMDRTTALARELGMNPYYLYRQKNMAGNFENVGYARPGKEGLYNILIMEEKQTILAAGSGASTKFVFEDGNRIERAENVKDLRNYIERIDEMLERKKTGIVQYLK